VVAETSCDLNRSLSLVGKERQHEIKDTAKQAVLLIAVSIWAGLLHSLTVSFFDRFMH